MKRTLLLYLLRLLLLLPLLAASACETDVLLEPPSSRDGGMDGMDMDATTPAPDMDATMAPDDAISLTPDAPATDASQ